MSVLDTVTGNEKPEIKQENEKETPQDALIRVLEEVAQKTRQDLILILSDATSGEELFHFSIPVPEDLRTKDSRPLSNKEVETIRSAINTLSEEMNQVLQAELNRVKIEL